jgi:hypothetical protein
MAEVYVDTMLPKLPAVIQSPIINPLLFFGNQLLIMRVVNGVIIALKIPINTEMK